MPEIEHRAIVAIARSGDVSSAIGSLAHRANGSSDRSRRMRAIRSPVRPITRSSDHPSPDHPIARSQIL
jgi:hypothetical protein